MFIFAHIAYPLLLFFLFARIFSIAYEPVHILLLVFFSILPDLDIVWPLLHRQKTSDAAHHEWVSHWPITYVPLLLWLVFNPSLAAVVAVFGVYFHLVLDTMAAGDGIMWGYPFSKKFVEFFHRKSLKGLHGTAWLREYRRLLLFKVETVAVALALVIIIF